MLQFDILQVQFQEGKESPATTELYKVLKDHKNPFMQDLVSSSFKHCYQDEARKVVGHDGLCRPPQSENGTDDDEEDEQEMYITQKPKTPSYMPSYDTSFDFPCPPSPFSLATTPRKRPRLAESQSSIGQQKKITSFFLSQQRPRN